MKKTSLGLLACVGFVALLCGPSRVLAQNVPLGTAANFAVLGATPNVTNTGPTVVIGDLGVWPAASVTGFPPGSVIGSIHLGDAVAQQAQTDLTTAYNDAAGRTCTVDLTGQVLGSGGTVLTLGPGVYCFTTTAQLTGNLILNGAGVYIFKIGTGLTTATGSSITPTNGAVACGVWWQVGSSATIGTGTALLGNVLALTSITVATGASVNGRVLARNGTVTLDSNAVTACSGGPGPPVLPPPTPIPGTPTATPTLTVTPTRSPTPPLTTPTPSAAAPIPTLEPSALMLLAIALAAVAFLVLRKNI